MQTTLSDHVRNHRASGLSTYLRLVTLAQAVGNPGSWVEVKDHHDGGTFSANAFFEQIKMDAAALGLTFEYRLHRSDNYRGTSQTPSYQIRAEKRGYQEVQYVRR